MLTRGSSRPGDDEPQTTKPSRTKVATESPRRSSCSRHRTRSGGRACLLAQHHVPCSTTQLCGGPASLIKPLVRAQHTHPPVRVPTDPPVRALRPGLWWSGSSDEGPAGPDGVGLRRQARTGATRRWLRWGLSVETLVRLGLLAWGSSSPGLEDPLVSLPRRSSSGHDSPFRRFAPYCSSSAVPSSVADPAAGAPQERETAP